MDDYDDEPCRVQRGTNNGDPCIVITSPDEDDSLWLSPVQALKLRDALTELLDAADAPEMARHEEHALVVAYLSVLAMANVGTTFGEHCARLATAIKDGKHRRAEVPRG